MSQFDAISPEGYPVIAPSGSEFQVMTPDEVSYFEDRVRRYMSDNHFVNIADLQDVDRMLIMELMCWRWGYWLSQERDYFGQSVDLDALQKSLSDYSKELRLIKKGLGIDKSSRDREKSESVADFIESLRLRAKEFGVMRESQLTKALTLFNELKALLTLHDNCTEEERQENNIEIHDLLDWIRNVAIPEYDEIDEHFRTNSQKFWIRTV